MEKIKKLYLNENIELKEKINFKTASLEDLENVLHLSEKMLNFHINLDPYYGIYSKYEDHREYYSDQLKKEDVLYIIAKNEKNKIVGLASGYITEIPETEAPRIGNLVSNYVETEYQNQGIGSYLHNYRMKWFLENNVKFVEMNVDASNKKALDLWRKKGFKDYQIKLRKDL